MCDHLSESVISFGRIRTRHGRSYILVDSNPEAVPVMAERLGGTARRWREGPGDRLTPPRLFSRVAGRHCNLDDRFPHRLLNQPTQSTSSVFKETIERIRP